MKTRSDSGDGQPRKTPLGLERRFDQFGDWLDQSWALRKMTPTLQRYPWTVVILTWVMRLLVGGTFAISGLAKGIDPWGTYYKLQEYLSAMHFSLAEWGNTVVVLSFLLFWTEFFIGTSLLTGMFRKATPIMAAIFMMVMLPLTLWIALANPVEDCGCFGDYITLSNWETFIKNVVLSAGIVWLIKFNSRGISLIAPYLQWIGGVGTSAYILAVGFIGYYQQPMVDFRQYKVGSRLFRSEQEPEYTPTYRFVYIKDGQEKTIGADDELPDEKEGWKFLRREEAGFEKTQSRPDQAGQQTGDFRVWDKDASEDVTETLSGSEDQLILFIPDITELSMATSWEINRLHDIATEQGTEFFAIVSGGAEEIEEWMDLTSGQYAIYTAEDTSIKELVRGNPALVRLKDGLIEWKTAVAAINLQDEEEEKDQPVITTLPLPTGIEGGEALACMTVILISYLGALALMTQLHRIRLR